jgi:hypothetical protein
MYEEARCVDKDNNKKKTAVYRWEEVQFVVAPSQMQSWG